MWLSFYNLFPFIDLKTLSPLVWSYVDLDFHKLKKCYHQIFWENESTFRTLLTRCHTTGTSPKPSTTYAPLRRNKFLRVVEKYDGI
ncbi:Uncharacterized protein APZ42_012497 [Daphnia magna]|uniref:Uncharacterized protein n=1 Tax=Daphnia magna TaxID=35525 RepID=A0A162RVB0_9CRUS|nr:Uncharacterized protein APZ42_012497 [Daphnia magna]